MRIYVNLPWWTLVFVPWPEETPPQCKLPLWAIQGLCLAANIADSAYSNLHDTMLFFAPSCLSLPVVPTLPNVISADNIFSFMLQVNMLFSFHNVKSVTLYCFSKPTTLVLIISTNGLKKKKKKQL